MINSNANFGPAIGPLVVTVMPNAALSNAIDTPNQAVATWTQYLVIAQLLGIS